MSAAAHPPAAPSRGVLPTVLPTYALYGETERSRSIDWLHCESIAARSRRHDWEIRPHRHELLFQFLHIDRGRATAALESGPQALAGPCLLAVPPLAPHGFQFAPDIDGTVITVVERHLAGLLAPAPELAARLLQPLLLRWPAGAAAASVVGAAVRGLREAFADTGAWRDLAIDAALLALAVAIGRAAPPPSDAAAAAGSGAALGHVRRFRTLVEAQFRRQPTLAALAGELGITPTQLNRACRQVLGHPALAVLHQRLLLEAQRDLAYTTLSIKQIALGLGFADAAYFTRFFQRLAGRTPTAWRAQAAR